MAMVFFDLIHKACSEVSSFDASIYEEHAPLRFK